MFSNQIFICHTDDHKDKAGSIAISLRGRGYRVFLDKDTLQPGQSYEVYIEKAIKRSSAFVFLVSPRSVSPGRFTLTELKFASQKWPHPANVVLPVLVEPTDLNKLPVYLKGATMLEAHGDLGAEVSAVIARMVSVRSYRKLLAVAAAIALVAGIGIYAVTSHNVPDPVPDGPSYSAVAECTRTGTVGKGTGATEQDAKDDAVSDCEDNGGTQGCCKIIDVR
jgi:TIR domain